MKKEPQGMNPGALFIHTYLPMQIGIRAGTEVPALFFVPSLPKPR